MPTETTGRPATLLSSLDAGRIWDAVRDGLAALAGPTIDSCQDEDRAEDLYHAIMRQAEVARVLWLTVSPKTFPKA